MTSCPVCSATFLVARLDRGSLIECVPTLPDASDVPVSLSSPPPPPPPLPLPFPLTSPRLWFFGKRSRSESPIRQVARLASVNSADGQAGGNVNFTDGADMPAGAISDAEAQSMLSDRGSNAKMPAPLNTSGHRAMLSPLSSMQASAASLMSLPLPPEDVTPLPPLTVGSERRPAASCLSLDPVGV